MDMAWVDVSVVSKITKLLLPDAVPMATKLESFNRAL